jgi:DNA-binding NarL/FixJ family response regulator
MTRVLLLDNDRWRYRGFKVELEEREFEVVGDVPADRIISGASAISAVNVILLSHDLVLDHGAGVIERLRQRHEAASLLVFGEDDSIATAAEMIGAGASGYFLLRSRPEQLEEALRLVIGGRLWAPREAVARLARAADSTAELRRMASRTVADESLIFRLLDRGLSNKEIGQKLGLAEVTVKSRLSKLYRKFGVTSRLQLLSAAIRNGILRQGAGTERKQRR